MEEIICSPAYIGKRLKEVDNKSKAIAFITDFNELATQFVPLPEDKEKQIEAILGKPLGMGRYIGMAIALLKNSYKITEGEISR